MRSGTCAAQQTLTPEAASILKHSLNLAARRGHAQVTPLHVASTLLSSRGPSLSLFRRACLHSHPPHPLHSRALELCFNVALNRLPSSPPLLPSPSLSNALIAALKRAQAHQRRGSSLLDHHPHPPLLALKVELHHLIISILDDPTVSRVMREAGFSSTAVKSNIEDSPSPPLLPPGPALLFPPPDTKFVFEALLGRNRKKNSSSNNNIVIVGDSIGVAEGLAMEVMRKVKNGEVPDEMKGAKVVEFPLGECRRVGELKRKVEGCVSGGGVVVYVGDLRWVVEGANNNGEQIDRLVGDVEKMVCDYRHNNNNNGGNITKVWIMAVASYQVYMRCQMRMPPLETQWALHALPLPSTPGLGLSLHASSVYDSRLSFFSQNASNQAMETKPFIAKDEQEKLTCCAECTSNFESEVQRLKPLQSSKQIPSWLQQYNTNHSHSKEFVELRRKWNRFCSSLHRDGSVQSLMGKSFSYSSSYPWWPKFNELNSISFTDYQAAKSLQSSNNLVPRFRRQQSCTTIEFDFGNATTKHDQDREPSLNSLKHMVGNEVKITLGLGNDPLFCDSSAESMELESERHSRRGEILKVLRENVPWQSESIHCIAEELVAEKSIHWILIEGNDFVAKRKLSLAIAESVFGSADFLLNLNAKTEDMEICRSEILERALKSNRKLVVLVEDVDMADSEFTKFLADGFKSGKLGEIKEESLEKIIFVITKDDSSDKKKNNRASSSSSSSSSVIEMTLKIEARAKTNPDHKRKADWEESANKSKTKKAIHDKETAAFTSEFESSINNNTLDLNIKANEEEEEETEKNLPIGGQISPISSDVTRETTIISDPKTPKNKFLDWIENRIILDGKTEQNAEIKAELRGKIKRAYEENCKNGNWNWDWDWDCRFRVEEGVVEGILEGFGTFSKGLFEKWVKEIFQTSLERSRYGGKGKGIDIRLCLAEKHVLEDGDDDDDDDDDGYMGSCLPNKISLSSSLDSKVVFM